MNLALLISGGGTTATHIIDACASGALTGITPTCVIASRSSAEGIEKLKSAGFPEEKMYTYRRKDYPSNELFGEALLTILKQNNINFIGQFGWLTMTPANVVSAYEGRIINQHPGPLSPGQPDFGGKGMYGMRVHAARLAFVRATGRDWWSEATTHYVTEEYDMGDVIGRTRVDIHPDDTPEILQKRMLPVEHLLQVTTLQKIVDESVQKHKRDTMLVNADEITLLATCKEHAVADYPHG